MIEYAITLHVGPAHDICVRGKDVENRGWQPHVEPPFRLAIHAAQPTGAIVAVATVVGWALTEFAIGAGIGLAAREEAAAKRSKWWRGPCGWVLRDVRVLANPVQARGRQRLWRLSAAEVAAITSQVRA